MRAQNVFECSLIYIFVSFLVIKGLRLTAGIIGDGVILLRTESRKTMPSLCGRTVTHSRKTKNCFVMMVCGQKLFTKVYL